MVRGFLSQNPRFSPWISMNGSINSRIRRSPADASALECDRIYEARR
jgi:hypothetical protein